MTLHISRAPLPRSLASSAVVGDERYAQIKSAIGEQPEWTVAIPWLHRVLASPSTGEPMLEAPRRGEDIRTACAYWLPLLYLLTYSLGWRKPERGLKWWYDTGKPTDDLRLELISDVWDRDGQLDWFVAWLLSSDLWHKVVRNLLPEWEIPIKRIDIDQTWIARTCEAAMASGIHNPAGGGDSLHLSVHNSWPMSEPAATRLLRSDVSERHAVLFVDSMVGWYSALLSHGAELPPLGDRSWYVDVVARPVGWLGTYRRSRVTGIWFSGRHRFHTVGA
jgi:hypothetical protein